MYGQSLFEIPCNGARADLQRFALECLSCVETCCVEWTDVVLRNRGAFIGFSTNAKFTQILQLKLALLVHNRPGQLNANTLITASLGGTNCCDHSIILILFFSELFRFFQLPSRRK